MKKLLNTLLLLLAIIFSGMSYAADKQKIISGECFKQVEGQEKENKYWVPCNADNTDIGFNQLNCQALGSEWRKWDRSCIQSIITNEGKLVKYRWFMDGRYLKVEEIELINV